MNHQQLFITLVILLFCSSSNANEAILKAAKNDSVKYCAEHSKEGCEFEVREESSGWLVVVRPIFRDKNGARVYLIGGEDYYFYDKNGRLINIAPGL